MLKKTNKINAPFKSFHSNVYIKHGAGNSLWQIRKNDNKGAISILYDITAYPNYIAKVNHNHQPNVEKVELNYLPPTMNNCCFSLSSTHIIGEEFSETAADLVAQQLLPIVTTDMLDYAFFEKPEIIRFWPAEKNGHYLKFMMEAAEKSDFLVEAVGVQVGGKKKPVEGFALRLK
jgi:hypothetical protein